jgi:hypothetical protein
MKPNCDGSMMGGGNMEAFDKLPEALRQALASSDHNWSARQVKRLRSAKTVKQAFGHMFDFSSARGAIEAILTRDVLKHRRDASDGLVCPDQR